MRLYRADKMLHKINHFKVLDISINCTNYTNSILIKDINFVIAKHLIFTQTKLFLPLMNNVYWPTNPALKSNFWNIQKKL